MKKVLSYLLAAVFAAASVTAFAQGGGDPKGNPPPTGVKPAKAAPSPEKVAADAAKAEKRAKRKAANKAHRDATKTTEKVTK